MLQPNKRARLIDFGAAHTATLPGGTSTQAVLKHGFAPVEQYQSKGHLGSWTDVYAMCATIYHCVTGLMPPNATDRMMGEEDFRWEALSCLTEIQQAALRQGLELNYKQRIQTMGELCAKLFSDEEPAPQPAPIPKPEPAPQPEPKPQPKPAEPPVSETGTIALGMGNNGPIVTAPMEEPIFTAPVERRIPEQKPEENAEKKNKKKPWIWATAGILAGLLLLWVISPSPTAPQTTHPDVPQFTQPTEAQTIQEAYGSRVLMVHDDTRQNAFRTGVKRDQVASITFLNTVDVPKNAVDASEKQDGSVMAWVELNGDRYDLYLAANGKIIAPEDCSYMFSGFVYMKIIDLSNFDTSQVVNMHSMFSACNSLSQIDLTTFSTRRVTDMSNMFQYTNNLKFIYGDFTFQNVRSSTNFMDTGDYYNGLPWEKWFR